MIDRYTTPPMNSIWDRQAKYERWKEVELAIVDAHAAMGSVPKDAAAKVRERATFTLTRCDEIEKETRHDLMAFVRNLSETSGDVGRYIHLGVTSYDVIDTALALLLRDSCTVVLESLHALASTIEKLSKEHIDTPEIGRTHGIHAEPITFGFKACGWLAEVRRNIARLESAKVDISVGTISGAVGIHGVNSPELETLVCKNLNLGVDPASTQIINRDRHANLMNTVALIGAGLERIATELRNLQRTEILEVQESFGAGQTGSSAMPHKRNPWNSETVCGLSRILRANATAMLESVASWHERDLTNSSLERIIFPDSFQLVHFMILRLNTILTGLQVFPDRMKQNLELMGDLVFSEHVMIALIHEGMSREDAYKVAQRNASKAWAGEDFQTAVRADELVKEHLSSAQLDEVFSLEHHLRYRNHTLNAVLNSKEG